jgi:hypothetical protein
MMRGVAGGRKVERRSREGGERSDEEEVELARVERGRRH